MSNLVNVEAIDSVLVISIDRPARRNAITHAVSVAIAAAMEEADVELLPVVDDAQTFIGVVLADDILKLDEILDETGG